jgi:hypothetical protein
MHLQVQHLVLYKILCFYRKLYHLGAKESSVIKSCNDFMKRGYAADLAKG